MSFRSKLVQSKSLPPIDKLSQTKQSFLALAALSLDIMIQDTYAGAKTGPCKLHFISAVPEVAIDMSLNCFNFALQSPVLSVPVLSVTTLLENL